MTYEIDEWTITKDRREDDLWLVYATDNPKDFRYFDSEVEAINFADEYSPVETE